MGGPRFILHALVIYDSPKNTFHMLNIFPRNKLDKKTFRGLIKERKDFSPKTYVALTRNEWILGFVI